MRDEAAERLLKSTRDQTMLAAKATVKRLQKLLDGVIAGLLKDDLPMAGYYAVGLRPDADRLLDLLLEMRVTADTVALLTEDGKS
jgi:hypothetical protein